MIASEQMDNRLEDSLSSAASGIMDNARKLRRHPAWTVNLTRSDQLHAIRSAFDALSEEWEDRHGPHSAEALVKRTDLSLAWSEQKAVLGFA